MYGYLDSKWACSKCMYQIDCTTANNRRWHGKRTSPVREAERNPAFPIYRYRKSIEFRKWNVERLLKTAHNSTYLHHVVHQNQRIQQQYDFHRMLNNETMVRVMRPECILTIKSIHFLLRNTNVIWKLCIFSSTKSVQMARKCLKEKWAPFRTLFIKISFVYSCAR